MKTKKAKMGGLEPTGFTPEKENVKHSPGPWTVSFEKQGLLGQDESEMKRVITIAACEQPQGVNGRGLMLAEIRVGDHSFGFGNMAINHHVTEEVAEANARRIVDCVNALDGIENPQEFVQKARQALAAAPKMFDALVEIVKEVPCYCNSGTNLRRGKGTCMVHVASSLINELATERSSHA